MYRYACEFVSTIFINCMFRWSFLTHSCFFDSYAQPEKMEPYWNARGVCINHWYHIKTQLDPNREKESVVHDNSEIEFANTPTGGKFDQPWGGHGWTTDPKHQTDPRAHVEPESEHF